MLKEVELSSQKILRGVKNTLSKDTPIDERLSSIIDILTSGFEVDSCSIFILNPGDILELYASKGLSSKSLHETTLRVGEGLVGQVALEKRTIAFYDIKNHPNFVYKPKTKEDDLQTMLATPILRNDKLVGVLVLQTTFERVYSEEDSELLEIISVLLSEKIYQEVFRKKKNIPEKKDFHARLEGQRLSGGTAIGHAVIHQRTSFSSDLISSDEKGEIKRLDKALKKLNAYFKSFSNSPIPTEQIQIFEAYQLFSVDKGWISKIKNFIHTGLTAEAAVQKVLEEMNDRLKNISDTSLREKMYDFSDLANRLQHYLSGKEIISTKKDLPEDSILVAHFLGPAELLDYDRTKIKGLLLQEASLTMHVVVVAQSLGIPIIGGITDIESRISDGEKLIVDGENGFIYQSPSDDLLRRYNAQVKIQESLKKKYQKLKNIPCITLDNVPVSLNMNAGLAIDTFTSAEGLFDGIGLYRTELPFMTSNHLPDTAQQIEIYKKAIEKVGNKPIVFRTLDIGSDKILPYLKHKKEENPAMGWRSIRITLDRRSLLRAQIRAFIRAVNGGDLYIMFPMITDVSEFIDAKKTLLIEVEREREKGGILPRNIKIGTMLEVPSLLFQLDELLKMVDFVSVGTNDLSQFLFAIDRSDLSIWNRYDVLSGPMLKVLKQIADKCKKHKVECSICGEMAGNPLDAMVLLALGFNKLSMNAGSLGAVKAMILSLNVAEAREYILSILDSKSHSLREKLRSFAVDHHVEI